MLGKWDIIEMIFAFWVALALCEWVGMLKLIFIVKLKIILVEIGT